MLVIEVNQNLKFGVEFQIENISIGEEVFSRLQKRKRFLDKIKSFKYKNYFKITVETNVRECSEIVKIVEDLIEEYTMYPL